MIGTPANILKVVLVITAGGNFGSGTQVAFNFNAFTTPASAQAAMTAVAAATTSDGSAFLDATTLGTFPLISNGAITDLAVTLTSSVKATSTTATISFTPAGAITAGANAGIAIKLPGAGIALGGSSACAVTAPTTGSPTCTASYSGSVLTVKLTVGTYTAAVPISATVTLFTNPTGVQAAMTNIYAYTSNDLSVTSPVPIDYTNAGKFPEITDVVAGASSSKSATSSLVVSVLLVVSFVFMLML